jgi:hypothetical protein
MIYAELRKRLVDCRLEILRPEEVNGIIIP